MVCERYTLDVSYGTFKRFIRAHTGDWAQLNSTRRFETEPGDEVQIDYCKLGLIYDPHRQKRRTVYAFIATLSHSRLKFVDIVYRQDQKSFVASHLRLFDFLGGVPKRLVIDNLKSGVITPDLYDPKLNGAYQEMAEHYGCFVDPARGKITGSYINSAFAKTDAQRAGFDETIMLNQDGHICEGSVENIFVVRHGVIMTPPVTDNILEGITRQTMITLVRDKLGMSVIERSIDRSEVYLAQEIFFTGTGAQITAITRVDYRPIGTGQIGPVTKKLREVFFDVVRGREEKYKHWCVPVYESALRL